MDILEKSLLIGLGLLNITREKAESMVHELTNRGTMRRGEAQELVNELVTRGEREREYLKSLIDEQMKTMVTRSKLPTRDDFQSLEQRIAELERKVAEKQEN